MERMKKKPELRSHDLWEVSSAAARLTSYACSISARHLQDDGVRMQFNRELAYYAKRVVDDVEQRRLSPEEGLREGLKYPPIFLYSSHLAFKISVACQQSGFSSSQFMAFP